MMTIFDDPRDKAAADEPVREPEVENFDPDNADAPSGDAEDASLQDWVEAENSRPTLPDETVDGMDDMDEEVRHQAEDLPLDSPGRTLMAARRTTTRGLPSKAHEIWEAAGRPHGRDQEHWDEAKEIIALQDSPNAAL